jgi:hypothetical protein
MGIRHAGAIVASYIAAELIGRSCGCRCGIGVGSYAAAGRHCLQPGSVATPPT